jgi:hypothetical protein
LELFDVVYYWLRGAVGGGDGEPPPSPVPLFIILLTAIRSILLSLQKHTPTFCAFDEVRRRVKCLSSCYKWEKESTVSLCLYGQREGIRRVVMGMGGEREVQMEEGRSCKKG